MRNLDYRDAKPLYLQLADDIRRQIGAGILQAGDRLPSVREQALSLAINPNTIQRAYRELEAQGWIVTVGGKGCFVAEHTGVDADTQELLRRFDLSASALLEHGYSVQALAERLRQGGNTNASNA